MESIAELRRICQADKLQRSRGLTRLNRFVSIYATFVALTLGASANVLTVASIAAGLAGAVLLALPNYVANASGVALLYTSFLLDQVDGEVARYRRTTVTGAYLDEIRHILIYAAPVFAVSMQLLLARPTLVMAGAGFAAAVSLIILRFNTNAHYLLFSKKVLSGSGPESAIHVEGRPRAAGDAGGKPSSSGHGRASWLGQVIPRLTYLTTNQVSLLLLLLAYVHLLRFVPNQTLHELVFMTYAATLVLLSLLGIWKMAYWGRIEKDCAEIARVVAERAVR